MLMGFRYAVAHLDEDYAVLLEGRGRERTLTVYCLLPGSLLPYLGIFGGIGVGLSATYGWQAVFNSLGAMSIMVGTLGLPGVVLFRVGNNALGALYAWAVDRLAGPAWRVLRRAAS